MTTVLKVTKSNKLVESGYKLSLNEQRLILFTIAKLDPRKPFPQSNEFTITATEFSDSFGVPLKQAYEALEDASSRLYERDIKTVDHYERTRERFRWVDAVKYWDGDGKVTISFTKHISPYLTKLYEKLTTYELNQISKLTTPYSIRIYELLVQFKKTGERYITLTQLREMLELGKGYSRFFDLKRRIIDPSILEINNTTDLCVDWDIVKKGRILTSLIFVFEENKK